MTLTDIETPAALIDETRMAANIARLQTHMNDLGVRLRPHVKTSKCIEVARRQQEAGARGITVSTLKEAEQFFAAGFADILYAVCISPDKLDRALALCRRGCALTLLVDSVVAAQALVATGHPFEVMIEIDSDGHRSGVQPEDAVLIEIGRVLHAGGAKLKGVLTHAGSSYDLNTPEALQQLAEQERALSVRAAERLRASGLPCPEVSVGSTPTALSAQSLKGVTEVRAGVYVFFDLVMANVGVCTPENVALSVLTTVIGHQPEKGWVIVDAGWMAMSRDRGTQRQKIDYGYGIVCDASGRAIEGLLVTAANQEHGIISRRDGTADPSLVERFPIGTKLRVLPNHACATGAQYPDYHLVTAKGATEVWPRFHGW
ncbi:MAG: DSD1 family PLP-dependent enzyme [Reyranella sp.]|nr:DSD1 family PLP-dependent enzyme [Reyranella sp.]